MKRTRKKHNAVIKAKGVVVAAVGGTGRGGERFRGRRWRARMLGKRSLEKRCPSDGGPRVREDNSDRILTLILRKRGEEGVDRRAAGSGRRRDG
jgi:hypothetical protein